MAPVSPISSLEVIGLFVGFRGWAGKNSSLLGRLSVDQQRNMVVFDGGRIHHHLFDVACIRQFEHRVDEGLLQNRTQAASTGFAGQCFFGNGVQSFGANL